MARMPDFEADIRHDWAQARDLMRDLMHPHQHDSPQPAEAPSPAPRDVPQPAGTTATTPPQEDTMTTPETTDIVSEIEDHAREIGSHLTELVGRVATVDREGLAIVARLRATPAGAAALALLDGFAQAEGCEPLLAAAGKGLEVVAALAPVPAADSQSAA